MGVKIAVILCLAGCTNAGGLDDFASNLGSDLAPLLALFGEQVTKQYLSESTSWIDSLLFALAPLGIITAIVSAIRVAGSPRLRALIGRAMESRGSVEADLMSSTSSDVCELWNGEGVVRVLGSPVLLQLIHTDGDIFSKDAGIYTFHEAVNLGFYEKNDRMDVFSLDTGVDDKEAESDVEALLARQNPPNLSLNVSIKPLDKRILFAFVVLGIILQGGILVYAGVAQYRLNLVQEDSTVAYGFAVYFIGTLSLAIGMFLCAKTIEISTDEISWEPTAGPKTVIWLQQGGQTVGDQLFESFARRSNEKVITSHKARGSGSSRGRFTLVTVAVSTALIGFIGQFVGLRAMHASVTVAQLVAVLIMTALRACAHIQRQSENEIKDPDQVDGHELDWLAKDLRKCIKWEIVTGFDYPDYSIDTGSEDEGQDESMAVMKMRARLGRLSKDWKLESRIKVKILQNAIEATMNDISTTMKLKDEWKDKSSFTWILPVNAQFKSTPALEPHFTSLGATTAGVESQSWKVHLTISRAKDEDSWGPWRTDRSELEAVLCLWVSSLTEQNMSRANKRLPKLKHIRLLGPATEQAKVDHRLWTHRGSKLNEMPFKEKEARYVGWAGNSNNASGQYLCVDADPVLETLCAQELYASFIFKVVNIIEEVGGCTTRLINDSTTDRPAGKQNHRWDQFRLSNTSLSNLASRYSDSGLGTLEEGYSCIIPAFRAVGKLPSPHETYDEARKAAKGFEQEGLWEKAAEVDLWLYSNCRKTYATCRDTVLLTAETENRLLRLTEKIVADVSSDTVHGKLRVWWDVAYSGCLMLSKSSPVRAASLRNLCITCAKIKPEQDSGTLRGAMKSLDIKNMPVERVIDFVQLALQKQFFDEAEPLAHSLWANTVIQSQQDTNGRHLPSELLMTVRQKRGQFFNSQELRDYLARDEFLRLTAATTVFTAVSEQEVRESKVPIDLLLIRQYRTPLQMAAEIGDEQIVRRLLDVGADVDAEPAKYSGRTALQAAAAMGHEGVVVLLLEANADVNAAPGRHSGRTALQAAADCGHVGIINLLLKAKGDYRADVNAAPGHHSGRTALQSAAGGGHEEIVKLLLEAGADVNAAPGYDSGRTALQAAAERGHDGIVQILLDAGADVNAAPSPDSGRTALQAAAEFGHETTLQLLLDANGSDADINAAPSGSGRTALQAAAGRGHEGIVRQLLLDDADIHAPPAMISGRTALQAAAESGYVPIVKLLLKAGVDINAAPAANAGRTALQAAAECGHEEVVKLLLSAKADVNSPPVAQSGRTALQAAAGAGHKSIVERLLRAKADVNAVASPDSGRTPLQAASGAGHESIVRILLEAGADVNAAPAARSGRTALQAAAESGDGEILVLLLDTKADINAKPAPHFGRTALQAAAEAGHEGIVDLLLLAGANINAKPAENSGLTALATASDAGHETIVKKLLEAHADPNIAPAPNSGRTALQVAAATGNEAIVDMLLAAKADVNAKPAKRLGRTALQAAAECGHEAIVSKLIEAQAIINDEPSEHSGRTALQASAGGGYERIVKLLLDAGAEVNGELARDSGRTALQAAAEGGHESIVKLLLDAKADIDAPPPEVTYGMTALTLAAGAGHVRIVQQLLEAGASANNISSRRPTGLQIAAGGGYERIVKLLLDAKADVNASPRPHAGRTALQAACEGGHYRIVEMLLKHNAEVNSPAARHSGRTALQAAAENGHEKVVGLLLEAQASVDDDPAPEAGKTALQCAAGAAHERILDLLLNANANLNAMPAPDSGRTAIQAAADGGHERIVDKLVEAEEKRIASLPETGKKNVTSKIVNAKPAHRAGRTTLQAAAEKGYERILQKLLDDNARLNAKPAQELGQTALQAAARCGHTRVVRALLEHDNTPKVNFNAMGSGRTALQAAAGEGHEEIVKLLVSAGADVNAPPAAEYGRTALQAAAESGHERIVNFLIDAKASVHTDPAPESGRTALQGAAEQGHEPIVRRLLEMEVNVNAPPATHFGRTALQAAAGSGHEKITKLLLKSSAYVNAAIGTEGGRTALMAAVQGDNERIVRLLLDAGADASATIDERPILMVAEEVGNKNIVDMLLAAGAKPEVGQETPDSEVQD